VSGDSSGAESVPLVASKPPPPGLLPPLSGAVLPVSVSVVRRQAWAIVSASPVVPGAASSFAASTRSSSTLLKGTSQSRSESHDIRSLGL